VLPFQGIDRAAEEAGCRVACQGLALGETRCVGFGSAVVKMSTDLIVLLAIKGDVKSVLRSC